MPQGFDQFRSIREARDEIEHGVKHLGIDLFRIAQNRDGLRLKPRVGLARHIRFQRLERARFEARKSRELLKHPRANFVRLGRVEQRNQARLNRLDIEAGEQIEQIRAQNGGRLRDENSIAF